MKSFSKNRASKLSTLLLVSSVLLVGCATAPPSGPSVMALPGSGKNFDQFRYDDVDCRNYAMVQIGGPAATQAGNDVAANHAVAGAVLGAVAGAAIGGHEGAGAGAGLGLLMGSASGAEESRHSTRGGQKRYDNAYTQCMYAKGQRVPVPANYNQRAPVAPTQYLNEVTPQQNYAQQNYSQQTYRVSPAYPPLGLQPTAPTAPRRAPASPPRDAGMPPDYTSQNPPITYTAPGQCMDCGIVESIRETVAQSRETGGGGALIGGLIGGVLGNQVGKGNGRALATIAGAIAGGAIGNREEEIRTPHNVGSFQIVVRMTDGSVQYVNQMRPPAWQLGDRVRVLNGELYAR